MNILDYIPKGKDNAVTRERLCSLTGMNDRAVREMISQARREAVIINLQNGDGYYIPTDRAEIERYVRQETARLKSIGWSLKAARKALP
jgi:biotin operon repressor